MNHTTLDTGDGRPTTRSMTRRAALRAGGSGLAAVGALGLTHRTFAQSATPAATPGAAAAHLPAALAQLDQIANQIMMQTGIPGMAVTVVSQDQVVYAKGFGVREAGKPAKVDADTVFQIASMSKPVASTVVAGVVGDGTVSWDSRMADLYPAFQLYDPYPTDQVTLRDLFAHRSGLPDHAGDYLEDIGYDRAEVLRRLRYLRPGSSFRAQYDYTNFGLTAAAVAAATAAGTTWEELSATKLYRPSGMSSTSSRYADFVAAKNRAPGHIKVNGHYVIPREPRDPDAQSPAGGVSSSVRDLAQWLRLQLADGKLAGKQVIAAEALAETHRPQTIRTPPPANPTTDRAGFYGLGWNVNYPGNGGIEWSHSGAFALGTGTAVYVVPALNVGIIAVTNAAPVGAPESVALSFLDLVKTGSVSRDWLALAGPAIEAAAGPAYHPNVDYNKPPTNAAPALPNDAYTGTYENDYYGKITIMAEGGGLVIQEGPKPLSFPLGHYDRDVFSYQPIGENAGGLSGVTFTIGADGKATGVLIENLNVNGAGSFARGPATS